MKRLTGLILTVMGMMILNGCLLSKAELSSLATTRPPDAVEMAAAHERGCPIALSAVYGERNYLDGIDVEVTWRNISGHAIKYCNMEIYLKNQVDERVRCEITGHDSVVLQFTGPFEPDFVHMGAHRGHKAALYHINAASVHISRIWVEFMDGTRSDLVEVDGMAGSFGFIGERRYN